MTEKQADVAGHALGTCDFKQYEHCGPHERIPDIGGSLPPFGCKNWKPVASQVPAQPPAAVLVLEMREFAQECLQRIKMNPHTDGNELHTKDAYQKIIALCDFCDPSVESLPLEKKHEIARKIYDSQPAPVPAQGTPPAQTEPWQPYHDRQSLCACRCHGQVFFGVHTEECLEKMPRPSAPAPPQSADTLEQEIYALEKEGCYCDTAAANVCVVHAMSQSLRRALRAALAESDKRARAEALEEAADFVNALFEDFQDYDLGILAQKIRALAAQPTPAPKEQAGE